MVCMLIFSYFHVPSSNKLQPLCPWCQIFVPCALTSPLWHFYGLVFIPIVNGFSEENSSLKSETATRIYAYENVHSEKKKRSQRNSPIIDRKINDKKKKFVPFLGTNLVCRSPGQV